jgi:hypothetical protein
MNVPATTRDDTFLQSMNTRRRFKRRGSKSASMMMMDLAAFSEVSSVECASSSHDTEGSTYTTQSVHHQQEDSRNGLVSGMGELNESFSSLATYNTADSRTVDHFLHV